MQPLRCERQHAIAVLQQYQALRRQFARKRKVGGARHARIRGGIRRRSLKQSKLQFHPQHVAHGVVQQPRVDALCGEQPGQVVTVGRAHHLHVHAGNGNQLEIRE